MDSKIKLFGTFCTLFLILALFSTSVFADEVQNTDREIECDNQCVLPACFIDSDCNDNNSATTDSCLNPNSCTSTCQFTPINQPDEPENPVIGGTSSGGRLTTVTYNYFPPTSPPADQNTPLQVEEPVIPEITSDTNKSKEFFAPLESDGNDSLTIGIIPSDENISIPPTGLFGLNDMESNVFAAILIVIIIAGIAYFFVIRRD